MADKEIRIDLGDGRVLVASVGHDAYNHEIYIGVESPKGPQDIAMVGIDKDLPDDARILRWLDADSDSYTDEAFVRIAV